MIFLGVRWVGASLEITNKVIRVLRCLVFLGVRWVDASLEITNKVIRALRCLVFLGEVLVVVRWVDDSWENH